MQLKKQVHKQTRPAPPVREKVIKLESFNPVVKPGLEIIHFSTVNHGTHCLIVTQPRARV